MDEEDQSKGEKVTLLYLRVLQFLDDHSSTDPPKKRVRCEV